MFTKNPKFQFHSSILQVKFMDFKIQNLVATVDLRFPIRLENLNQMHGQFSSYEPELFPGLIYRMVKPRVVLLIFVNGKIVFTGAKSNAEISESLENIYPILQSFRKNWTNMPSADIHTQYTLYSHKKNNVIHTDIYVYIFILYPLTILYLACALLRDEIKSATATPSWMGR